MPTRSRVSGRISALSALASSHWMAVLEQKPLLLERAREGRELPRGAVRRRVLGDERGAAEVVVVIAREQIRRARRVFPGDACRASSSAPDTTFPLRRVAEAVVHPVGRHGHAAPLGPRDRRGATRVDRTVVHVLAGGRARDVLRDDARRRVVAREANPQIDHVAELVEANGQYVLGLAIAGPGRRRTRRSGGLRLLEDIGAGGAPSSPSR